MKRRLNGKAIRKWRVGVGDIKDAAPLIKEVLKCSQSKADQIAACRYDRLPPPLELEALSRLMSIPLDELTRVVSKTPAKAS